MRKENLFLDMRLFLGISYNRPKLCPNATWNAFAVTFATVTLVGSNPWAIFINRNNTIYAANRESGIIRVWREGSSIPIRNISGNLITPYSLFVSDDNDVYVDNGATNFQVDQWSSNATSGVAAMYTCGACAGLFIDIKNFLYCTVSAKNQVISKSLDSRLNVWSVVAGTGVAAATPTTLDAPRGISVDTDLNLYVADCNNNRIQKFSFGQLAAITIVGSGAAGTPTLNCPSAIIFDADGYIYISDSHNHRILRQTLSGFRCIASCGGFGPGSTQMINPLGFSFDSYGNFYTIEWTNNRILRWSLTRNSCGKNRSTTKHSFDSIDTIDAKLLFRFR